MQDSDLDTSPPYKISRGSLNTSSPGSLPVAGRVVLIMGPMFAGKTNHIIDVIERYELGGKRVMVLRPHFDTRYSKLAYIVSHTGRKKECYVCSEADMLNPLGSKKICEARFDVCVIDEAQFFDAQGLRAFCNHFADKKRKTIYIAGLDGDSNRQVFGGITDLVPIADHVEKLNAVCHVCKRDDAPFTWRKVASNELKLIGGADEYMAVCRMCYAELSEERAYAALTL